MPLIREYPLWIKWHLPFYDKYRLEILSKVAEWKILFGLNFAVPVNQWFSPMKEMESSLPYCKVKLSENLVWSLTLVFLFISGLSPHQCSKIHHFTMTILTIYPCKNFHYLKYEFGRHKSLGFPFKKALPSDELTDIHPSMTNTTPVSKCHFLKSEFAGTNLWVIYSWVRIFLSEYCVFKHTTLWFP